MGIRSRAEDLIDEFKGTPYEPGRNIIIFDFKGKVSTRFWENLKRVLIRPSGGRAVLRHVVLVSSGKVARILARLVRHYGGDIMTSKVEDELQL